MVMVMRFAQGLTLGCSLLVVGCALRERPPAYQTYTDDVSVQKGWHVHEGRNNKGAYSVWFHEGPAVIIEGFRSEIPGVHVELERPNTEGPTYIVSFDYRGQRLQFDGASLRKTHKNRDSDGINDPHELWIIQNHKVDDFKRNPAFRFTFDSCTCYGGRYICEPYNQERIAQAKRLGFEVPSRRELARLSDYAEQLVKEHSDHHIGDKDFVFSAIR